MRVYIASSVRNAGDVVRCTRVLRAAGHEVFSFIEQGPAGVNDGRDFPELGSVPAKEFLRNAEARGTCDKNFDAITWADAVLLLLPAGASAHFEAGFARGLGKLCFALRADWSQGLRELAYFRLDGLCDQPEDVLAMLSHIQTPAILPNKNGHQREEFAHASA